MQASRDELIISQEGIMRYVYGMRLRGYSIGCQPMDGLKFVMDSRDKKYHDILVYDRELNDAELFNYELDFLGTLKEKV